jgi:hypothetical protein
MHPPHSAPPRRAQDRAQAVATSIVHAILCHLQKHWLAQVLELRDQVAQTLRDEFHDLQRITRDEIRPNDE